MLYEQLIHISVYNGLHGHILGTGGRRRRDSRKPGYGNTTGLARLPPAAPIAPFGPRPAGQRSVRRSSTTEDLHAGIIHSSSGVSSS